MKILMNFVFACFLTIVLTYFEICANKDIITTLYNIIGIVFSIGMGLIVTFSISGVRNKSYILDIRKSINTVRNKFIILFFICTLLIVVYFQMCENILQNNKLFEYISNFILSFFIISIVYFVFNFINIQKLKDDIFDRLLEEEKEK